MGGNALKQEYTTTVVYTEGRNLVCTAVFDIPAAEIALEILNEGHAKRMETAVKIGNCLKDLVRQGPLGNKRINVTTKSRSGLIRHPDVAIGWRNALLIAKAIQRNDPEGLESFKTHLTRFVRGLHELNGKPMLPFMFSEGIIPKG